MSLGRQGILLLANKSTIPTTNARSVMEDEPATELLVRSVFFGSMLWEW